MCAPSLDPPQLRRRQSFVLRKSRTVIVPAAVIPPHFLDAENAFSEGSEDPPHSSWASSSETPVWTHYINATADVSPCNGISAIIGQRKACARIAMILNGRGLSPPPPFGLRSLYAHTSYHLTWHTAPMIHRSHKLATMSSYSSCPLCLSPMDTFTTHGGPSRIRLCRTVHDGLECSPIRRRLGVFSNTCY